jgi:hypothetical protein
VFVLADRGGGERCIVRAKAVDESTTRLFRPTSSRSRSPSIPTAFRCEQLERRRHQIQAEFVVHGDGDYADGDVHMNICESCASLARRWLSPHRGISKDKLRPYPRVLRLRHRVYRKLGKQTVKSPSELHCELSVGLFRRTQQDFSRRIQRSQENCVSTYVVSL